MEHTTAAGTFTGTALTVAVNIGTGDILKTAILAAVGAAVSFCVSYGLKALIKWVRE